MFGLLKNLAFLEALIVAGYFIFYACLKPRVRQELGWKPALLFGGLAAGAFLSPNLWAAHLFFLLAIPVLARTREQIGSLLLIALFAVPSLTLNLQVGSVPIFGQTAQGTLALGGLGAMLARGGAKRKRPMLADLPALAIGILLIVIGARDTSLSHAFRQMLFVGVSWGVPYYVVTRSLPSPQSARRSCLWLAAAAAMMAVVVIFEMYSYWPMYSALNDKYGIPRGPLELVVKVRAGLMRAEGPMGEATAMGFVLVAGLAALLVCRQAFRKPAFHVALIALILAGLVAPQSRGGWLGAGLVLVGVSLFRSRSRNAAPLAASAIAASTLVYFAISYTGGESPTGGSIDYRSRLLTRGLEEFQERPLGGASYSKLLVEMRDLIQGEGIVDFVNSYIYFALLTGLIGGLTFLATMIWPVGRLWLRRRAILGDIPTADAAAFCSAFIASAAVMYAFTSFEARTALLLQIIIGLATGLSLRGELRTSASIANPTTRSPEEEIEPPRPAAGPRQLGA